MFIKGRMAVFILHLPYMADLMALFMWTSRAVAIYGRSHDSAHRHVKGHCPYMEDRITLFIISPLEVNATLQATGSI